MVLKTGIDLVELPDFKRNLALAGQNFLLKVLHPEEIKNKEIPSLAGLFAAKESISKTGFIKPGQWLEIMVINNSEGKPEVYRKIKDKWKPVNNLSISISHTDNFAVALAVYLAGT